MFLVHEADVLRQRVASGEGLVTEGTLPPRSVRVVRPQVTLQVVVACELEFAYFTLEATSRRRCGAA